MTTVIQKEVRMIFILKKMLFRTTLVMRRESLYEHLWVQSWHVSDWVKICWLNFSEILHEYCHLRFRKIDCLSFFGKMFATAQVRVFWSMELCFFILTISINFERTDISFISHISCSIVLFFAIVLVLGDPLLLCKF